MCWIFSWVFYKDITFNTYVYIIIIGNYNMVFILFVNLFYFTEHPRSSFKYYYYYLTVSKSLLIFPRFKRFDNQFIRPYLLKHHQGAEPKILETYSKLAMKDAMDYMRRNASTVGNISGTESMSAIFRNYTAGNLNGRLVLFSFKLFSVINPSKNLKLT